MNEVATGRLTYYRQALFHPAQGFVAAAIAGSLASGVDLALASMLALGAEAVLLLGLPRLRVYRDAVDAEIARERSRALIAARSQCHDRMHDRHRRELESLELLADDIRTSRRDTDGETARAWPDLEALLEAYTHLAICRSRTAQALGRNRDEEIALELADAEATAARGEPCTASWARRRGRILQRRIDVRREASVTCGRIDEELDTIAALMWWTYEKTMLDGASEERDRQLGVGAEDVAAACETTLLEEGAWRDVCEDRSAARTGRSAGRACSQGQLEPKEMTRRGVESRLEPRSEHAVTLQGPCLDARPCERARSDQRAG